MYDRIVVALDGSPMSREALAHAARLAASQGSKMLLLHVVDELGMNLPSAVTPDAFWAAARAAGERILDAGRAHAAKAGISAETTLVELRTFGSVIRRVAEAIVDEAQRWDGKLVVIGSHGRRGFAKLLLGSVAEGVIRISPVPVLLVRAPRADAA